MLSAPLGASAVLPRPDAAPTARQALELVVNESVRRSPCYVLFSGGRDSSAILAIATHVARRHGLPDPIPVTACYPDDPDADEDAWQDMVLRHLGLHERVLVRVTDQRRALGEVSRRNLEARGLVWPAAVQSQSVLFESLSAGSILTGEGGDVIVNARRVTPLMLLSHNRGRPSRALLRASWEAAEPGFLHRRRERRLWTGDAPSWLRQPAIDLLIADSLHRPPLAFDRETWAFLFKRSTSLVMHNSTIGARECGLAMAHPLADERFVAALALEGGRWGFRGRTHLFRHLVGDLLPDAILSRTTKAAFNASRWGDEEREFADGWSGGGMNESLVDPDALRAEWLAPHPQPAARFLVHVAWLHDQGLWNEHQVNA